MKLNVKKNVIFSLIILFSNNLFASDPMQELKEKLKTCVNEETQKHLLSTRTESVTFNKAAPKGSLIQCKTKRRQVTKLGNPPRPGEKIDKVSCRLISAEFRPKTRTKIFSCEIRNNRPFAHAQVSGKGCEHDNYAVWEIKTTYRKVMTVEAGDRINDICWSRL